jgi:hypothetical protein
MTKNYRFALSTVALLAVLFVAFAPSAQADEWNRKTIFTTNQPLRIPGNVLLPAGTYVIKRLDAGNSARVQIMDATETKVYATVFGIPDYLDKPAQKPVLQLGETPAGSPRVLRAWHYPGSGVGVEFPMARETAKSVESVQ